MNTNFQITAIDATKVSHLFAMNDEQLAQMDAVRQTVDSKPGFPCRVSLEDAEIGEEVILFPYKNHDVTTPYKSESPIYVRKDATATKLLVNEVPFMLLQRMLSLRAFDENGMMLDTRTIDGKKVSETLHNIFLNKRISYIHIHNSGPGCFNCSAARAA